MDYSDKEILLVEDNPDDVELTLLGLKQNNMDRKVFHVANGADALDYLFAREGYADRNLADMPRLILLDVKLPKIDGIEVLRRIRENRLTKRIPVVMLTSSKEEQDIVASYDLGSNAYVRKPIDMKQFNDTIKNLGVFWMQMNETASNTAV